jgi:hypothetical protein
MKKYSSIMKAHDKQVDDKESILPMGSRILAFVGGKGRGKTSAVLSLLTDKNSPYYKYFDNIILCSPSAPNDDKLRDLYDEVEEDGHYFEVLNEQTAEEMRDMLISMKQASKRKNPQSLLILDDVTHSFPTGRKPSHISGLFTNSRHLASSIWVITHKYNSMPSIFRNQLDGMFLYKTNSKGELASLKHDLPFDEELLEYNFYTATSEPYGFLYINLTGHDPKMYNKRFEEL